jgi:2-C-methyl-D-erythritol 4-phosphate cytidylyltransferase
LGAAVPKQYLTLAGKTVLEHTLLRFCSHPDISGIVVAVAPDDRRWEQLKIPCQKPLFRVSGGSERCHSVLSALSALCAHAAPDDWVLVHDAARPCVRPVDIQRMINELKDDPVGGLLATPVCDTMKRSNESHVVRETVDRTLLWHALTPQMFRLQALHVALERAITDGIPVTDESSAMEHAGQMPRLVQGHADNIKITHPQDLALAEFFLRQQQADRL